MLRLLTALAVSTALVLGAVAPANAAESDLERARRRASEVAAELAAARTALADVEREVATVTARVAETQARVAELRGELRAQAVDRFIRGGAGQSSMSLVLHGEDIGSAVRADALARSVTVDTDEVLDDYSAASDDLVADRARLEVLRERAAEALDVLDRRAAEATAELERQTRLEEERLAAEAAARAAAEERARGEAAARVDAERVARERAGARASSQGSASAAGEAPAAGGSGTGFLCPVAGARAFTNDWGQPRSGGRRHQGTDILSPRGTPVVASVSGTVRGHQSSLGGLSYYLSGDDGNTYFGTHLDSLSGVSGRVAQGTVIGRVGDSGNARGGPTHLHFEIHPGGGGAVNPYPTLAQSC